jgi:hypothetical protein
MSTAHPRAVGAVDLAVGTVLVAAPELITRMLARPHNPVSTTVLRVLGLRSAAQGVALLIRPHRTVAAAAAAADLLHAASMVALARWRPGYRRPAAVSAVAATGTGAWAAVSAANGR